MHVIDPKTIDFLKQTYQIDLVKDILLGRNDRVLFYGDVINPQHIEFHLIHGEVELLGYQKHEKIELNDLFNRIDLNNRYAEVAGKKEYLDYVNRNLFVFDRDSDITFPIRMHHQRIWIRVLSMPIKNHVVSYQIANVTNFLNHEEELYDKTHRDSLTQLFNKYTLDYHYGLRYLWDRFHAFYLDLDNFKIINDTYGHHIGNVVLIEFAQILKKYTNEYNRFYRIGGDEFVGLFFEDEEIIKQIAENIIKETRLIKVNELNMLITVSIGVIQATHRDDVIRKADDLLYRVKANGKNSYLYDIEK